MGLDAVEIVIETEKAFDVVIEDQAAAAMFTPRQLIDHVMAKVGRTDRAACLTQRAFHVFRRALVRHAHVQRADVEPATPMSDLIPAKGRRHLLNQLLDELGVVERPKLVRPRAVGACIMGGSIVLGVATAGWLWLHGNSSNIVLSVLEEFPISSGLFVAAVAGWLGALASRPLKNAFPRELATAGEFARWIVAHAPALVGAPPGPWSRDQVAKRVREIVIGILGCEREYHEDARFIEDLGVN